MTRRSLTVLRAMVRLESAGTRLHANAIAREAAAEDGSILDPVYRLGNGAVKGSWSGRTAACHRILGSLGSLRKGGYIVQEPNGEWRVTDAGAKAAKR